MLVLVRLRAVVGAVASIDAALALKILASV